MNVIAFKAIGYAYQGMTGGLITILSEDYPALSRIQQPYAIIGLFSFGNLLDEKDSTFFKDISAYKIEFILQTFQFLNF